MERADWFFIGFLVFIWGSLALLILLSRPKKEES